MLNLYYCRLPEEEPAVPEGLLSAYREEKLKKQTNARARLQSVNAELLLRRALKDSGFPPNGPLDIGAGEFGKPFLRGGECFFSLSHSACELLCALGSREIGADIQVKTKARPSLMMRCFSEAEQSYVFDAADPDAAFTEIWVKKESLIKRIGRGLAIPLASFCVFDGEIAPLIWHTTEGEYHLAVCSDLIATEKPKLIEVKTSVLFP